MLSLHKLSSQVYLLVSFSLVLILSLVLMIVYSLQPYSTDKELFSSKRVAQFVLSSDLEEVSSVSSVTDLSSFTSGVIQESSATIAANHDLDDFSVITTTDVRRTKLSSTQELHNTKANREIFDSKEDPNLTETVTTEERLTHTITKSTNFTSRTKLNGDKSNSSKEPATALEAEKLDFNFSLPWVGAYTTRSFRNSPWFLSLLDFASQSDPKEPIITLCADVTFKEALLNWLIAVLVRQTKPPRNILVVTNTAKLCSFLHTRNLKIKCIQLSVYALLKEDVVKTIKAHQFNQLLTIRMSVMRILNHFGYDVLNLDSDAILLKNPVPVLDWNGDSDVVGTFGGGRPTRLFKEWGVVLCMGAVLIRSTAATELLWRKMLTIRTLFEQDDQVLFNDALKAMSISWSRVPANYQSSTNSTDLSSKWNLAWEGHTSTGLKVTLLPQGVACRGEGCVEKVREKVYIWHHGSTRHKIWNMSEKAGQDGVWFLRKDWEKVENRALNGIEWLSRIAIQEFS